MPDENHAAEGADGPGPKVETKAVATKGVDAGNEGGQAAAGRTVVDERRPDPAPVAPWPDDWRQKMAGGDEKALKRLVRYQSPQGVMKALLAADAKINSGQVRESFPEDGTQDEKAAWRKAEGVPDTWEGYHGALEGIVIGEQDRPLVDEFLQMAHANNDPPPSVRAAVDWYFRTQERIAAERTAADETFRRDSVETMREEMGADFRRNLQDLKNWLDTGPAGQDGEVPFGQLLTGARLADGTLAGDNPRLIGFLLGALREINPLSTVVPSTGADSLKTIDDEIAAIEQDIESDRKAYHADKAKRARYRELLEARDRAQGRRVA